MELFIFSYNLERNNGSEVVELEIEAQIADAYGSPKVSSYKSMTAGGDELDDGQIEAIVEEIGEEELEAITVEQYLTQQETETDSEMDADSIQLCEELGIKAG